MAELRSLELYKELEDQRRTVDSLINRIELNSERQGILPEKKYPAMILELRAFEKICKKYSDLRDASETYKEFERQMTSLKFDVVFNRELREMLSDENPYIMDCLYNKRNQLTGFSDQDLNLIVYLMAGFQLSVIAILSGKGQSSIRSQISRLKKKADTIEDDSIREAFLSVLR